MALPWLFSQPYATTLSEAVSITATEIKVSEAAPAALQQPGQFSVLIGGTEYVTVTGGTIGNGKTWQVLRGQEGSTRVAHAAGETVLHLLTAGAIGNESDAEGNKPSLRTLGTGAKQAAPGTTLATAEAAVASEATRAEVAESAKLAKAENLKDLSSATTARTALGLGSAAVESASAFDAKGEAAAERTRAEIAEALLIPLSQKAAANGVASLDSGGHLPTSQLPALALTDPYVVSSEAAQLALTVHIGDFAIRTDIGKTFVQNGGKAGTMADWTELVTPGDVISVNSHTGAVTLTAADVAAIPTSAEGVAGGVAALDGEGHVPGSQLPPSVVNSSAVGFAPSVIWLNTTPEFYGARGDGVTDDTAAFQSCSKAIKASGGGVARLSAKTYIVDGLIWESGVKWEGRGSRGSGTVLKAKAGSSNLGQIMIPAGAVNKGGWKGIYFKPNGNVGQWAFYLFAQELEGTGGGVWNCEFEDLQMGVNGGSEGDAWSGGCMWFRGGLVAPFAVHQFNTFRNVSMARENSGSAGLTNRCLKLTGQCEKFEYDAACVFDGRLNLASQVGVNIEMSREFLFSTTLATEAAAGATKLTLASSTGFEANKRFSVGEGAKNELCQVESVAGNEVTLKSPLTFVHASGSNTYLLSGTVAAPTTMGPREIIFRSGAVQNADLEVLVDTSTNIVFDGTDFENQSRVLRVRNESYQVNLRAVHLTNTSEGKGAGTATATVGSSTLAGATAAWIIGEPIAGPGVPFGATVTNVEGSAVTISAPVEANGTSNAQTIPLTRGGKGEGYAATYERGCQGTVSYYTESAFDRGVISLNESAVRVIDLARGTALPTIQSVGVALAKNTAESLQISAAREVVLLNGTTIVKTLMGLHAVGESVIVQATAANTRFETGGNISIPSGKLTLEANDFATFMRTDRGAATWQLVAVQRAKEAATAPLGTNGLLFPLAMGAPIPPGQAAIGTANKAWLGRAIAPATGHIKGILVFVGGTVSAGTKARVAILDCGEASAGKYTVLWESEEKEIKESEKENLVSMGAPELLCEQNQQFVMALMNSSTTTTFGHATTTSFTNWYTLPEGWFPASGGAHPKLSGLHTYGSLSFGGIGAALTEAEVSNGANVPGIMALVS